MSTPRFAELPEDAFEYGRVDQVSPSIRRVIAENPSKFTYRGTGTYIIGRGDVVVIDPGPLLDSHRDALARALDGERVRAILVTHCHADHSPLAGWLRAETGAPTVGFGPHPRPPDDWSDDELTDDGHDDGHGDDSSDAQEDGSEDGEVKVEERTDYEFTPDVVVRDGDVAPDCPGVTFTAVHTPGHTSNHVCYAFAEEGALFTGDHVMGWSTTVVSPPDGDMAAYMSSLRKVVSRADGVLWPTHGPPRFDAVEYVSALLDHRLERERQVFEGIRSGVSTIADLVPILYAAVPESLHKAAARSLLAHVMKLVDEGTVVVVDGGRPSVRSMLRIG